MRIDEVIAIGGVAHKSHLVMQTMADVLGRTIKITASTQTPALGAGMYAAVASGVFNTMEIAIKAMGPGFDQVYVPQQSNIAVYEEKYQQYLRLGKVSEEFKNRCN